MKRYRLLIVLFILLVRGVILGQEYQNISTEDGLPSNNVYRIAQDAKGFIWFITDKGMVKYDGASMKLFTTKEGLPVNDIWNIRATPDGKVWYFSKSKELGYILNDKVFTFPSENVDEILIPNVIFQDGNDIGFDKEGLVLLKNDKWNKVSKNIVATKRILDLIGNTHASYIITNNDLQEAAIYDTNNCLSWVYSWDINKRGVIYNHGQISGKYYVNVRTKSIDILDLEKRQLKIFFYKDLFGRENTKYTRLHYVSGALQISTEYGIAHLTPDLQIKEIVAVPEELKSHFSLEDNQGNIWVATLSNGIYFLPNTAAKNKLFLHQKVKHILKHGNNIHVNVQGKGVYKIDPISKETTLKVATDDFLYGIFKNYSNDNYFLTTRSNIYSWETSPTHTSKVIDLNFKLNAVSRELLTFDNGYGYGNGALKINKIDLNNFEIIKSQEYRGISAIIEFKDNLLIGANGGLAILNKELELDSKKQLLDVPILCIRKLYEGTIIAGSDGNGAYLVGEDKAVLLKGSQDLSVEDIAQDEKGSLYLGTNEGIVVFKKDENTYSLSRKILKADGLLSNNVNCIAILANELYAGGDNGIAILDLDLLRTQEEKHQLFLENIAIGNDTYKNDTIVAKFTNANALIATFGILDFKGQDNHKRSYQLQPISKEWNAIETNQINLGNLDPNTYKLTFKTIDHKGTAAQKMIILIIEPLWYQTNWFKALLTLALLLILVILTYYSTQYFQRRKTVKLIQENKIAQIELKALRAQMNPHFVFNSLTAIQYYINNNENEISEKYLVKFSKLIRKFFQLSGEQEIFLNEEIALLEGYLEIEKLRFKSKLIYTITVDDRIDIQKFTVPSMLLQPVIENAVNHGVFNKEDEGNVAVSFIYVNDSEIEVLVKDDGVGYINTLKRSKKKKSSSVTAERIHFLNHSDKWRITQKIEEVLPDTRYPGTQITFTIKRLK